MNFAKNYMSCDILSQIVGAFSGKDKIFCLEISVELTGEKSNIDFPLIFH